MANCKTVCSLCPKMRISTAVNVDGSDVIINLPDGSFNDGERMCIVIAQNIPQTAQIGSNVFISITGNTQRFPLVTCSCRPVTVCGIRSRTRYSVTVETSATGGVFKMRGKPCCSPSFRLASLNEATATAPATPATTPTT